MGLRVEEARRAGARVVAVAGEIDIDTAPSLREAVSRAVEDRGSALIVDLTECGFIDSTGISILAAAARNGAGNGEARVAVACRGGEQVEHALRLTGLERLVAIAATVDEAAAAVRVD